MSLTTPSDALIFASADPEEMELESVKLRLEKAFKSSSFSNHEFYYQIRLIGQYTKNTLDKVCKEYESVGWKKVEWRERIDDVYVFKFWFE